MSRSIWVVLAALGAGNVALLACDSSSDGGAPSGDAGVHFDGSSDAGAPAVDEGGVPDAGLPEAGLPDDAGDGGDAADAGPPPVIVSTVKADTPVDHVGQDYGAPVPDAEPDATVTAVIEGAFDALTWVSTDADGVADPSSHQWDTLVDDEPLPDVGTGYLRGEQTWTTAIADGATILNDDAGRVSLPAGTHTLTVSVEATHKMVPGQHFRLYARGGGVWVAGPIFVW